MADPQLTAAIAAARTGDPRPLAAMSHARGWRDALESLAEMFEPGGEAHGSVLTCEEIVVMCRRLADNTPGT